MRQISAIIFLILTVLLLGCQNPTPKNVANVPTIIQTKPENQTGFIVKDFPNGQIFKKYLLYLPKEYGQKDKKFPIILQLHNAAYRGENIEKLKETGLLKSVTKGVNSPFIVISPLCPQGKSWIDDKANAVAILDEVLKNYAADVDQVYLIGHSIGAMGTWQIGAEFAEKFAAISPLANAGNLTAEQTTKLKDMPIWAFHGQKDDVVPLGKQQETVYAVKNAGNSTVKFSILPNKDHSLIGIYDNGEILNWFLTQTKKQL